MIYKDEEFPLYSVIGRLKRVDLKHFMHRLIFNHERKMGELAPSSSGKKSRSLWYRGEVCKHSGKAGWYLAKMKHSSSFYPILEDSFKGLRNKISTKPVMKKIVLCRKIKGIICRCCPLKPYKLPIESFRWQKEAKKVWWENNGRELVSSYRHR